MSGPRSRKANHKKNGAPNRRMSPAGSRLEAASKNNCDARATSNLARASPDDALFAELIEIANHAGRADLVEELRRRAVETAPPPPDVVDPSHDTSAESASAEAPECAPPSPR